jgi:hypothetical protein
MTTSLPVLIEVTVRMVVSVPSDWNEHPHGLEEQGLRDHVEFWLNDSSHCAGNEIIAIAQAIEAAGDDPSCGCSRTKSKFVRVATPEDCEMYDYKEPT